MVEADTAAVGMHLEAADTEAVVTEAVVTAAVAAADRAVTAAGVEDTIPLPR